MYLAHDYHIVAEHYYLFHDEDMRIYSGLISLILEDTYQVRGYKVSS